jgi:putative acyl-CoA dehydrogenase
MPSLPPQSLLATHEVTNQPPPRGDIDLWASDPWLGDHLAANGGQQAPVAALARRLGLAETREAGRSANRHLPELVGFDRAGRRLDEVRFHPAWHRMMQIGIEAG